LNKEGHLNTVFIDLDVAEGLAERITSLNDKQTLEMFVLVLKKDINMQL